MKKKLRITCSSCEKRNSNFFLIKKKGKYYYWCSNCGFVFEHIKNLKMGLGVSLFVLLLIVSCTSKVDVVQEYDLLFRVNAESNLKYELEVNNSFMKSGDLSVGWNDIRVSGEAGVYRLYYWREGHYVNVLEKSFGGFFENVTYTKELEANKKYSEVNVSISNDYSSVGLSFSDDIEGLSYCFYRSVGFLRFKPVFDVAYCVSDWVNESETQNLSDNRFFCDGIIKECVSVIGNKCFFPVQEVRGDADECYYVGEVFGERKVSIPFYVDKSDYFDSSDYVQFWVYTADLTPINRVDGKWGYQDVLLQGDK